MAGRLAASSGFLRGGGVKVPFLGGHEGIVAGHVCSSQSTQDDVQSTRDQVSRLLHSLHSPTLHVRNPVTRIAAVTNFPGNL